MFAAALFALSWLAADQHRSGLFGYLMDYQLVSSGDNGQVYDKDIVIAQTSVQWDKMRSVLGIDDAKDKSLQDLHGPLGAMDWTREQVVFARASEQRTGGYKLSLLRLTKEREGDVKVELLLTPPKPGTLSIEVLTTPYVLFRMKKTTGQTRLFVQTAKPHEGR